MRICEAGDWEGLPCNGVDHGWGFGWECTSQAMNGFLESSKRVESVIELLEVEQS